jgi:hypothetical protein
VIQRAAATAALHKIGDDEPDEEKQARANFYASAFNNSSAGVSDVEAQQAIDLASAVEALIWHQQ